MRVAVLYSGGKDSTYAAYIAKQSGHDIACLVTVIPPSAESKLLHHPNIHLTSLQALSMNVPCIVSTTNLGGELDSLSDLLKKAVSEYKISGAVHGGIASNYQRENFESACRSAKITPISPAWGLEAVSYMKLLLELKFSYIITSVSSDGLDESWLGKKIDQEALQKLQVLSSRYGFNLNFEGGEAETFVLDSPIFSKPIILDKVSTKWDGYRGTFEIEAASLDAHA